MLDEYWHRMTMCWYIFPDFSSSPIKTLTYILSQMWAGDVLSIIYTLAALTWWMRYVIWCLRRCCPVGCSPFFCRNEKGCKKSIRYIKSNVLFLCKNKKKRTNTLVGVPYSDFLSQFHLHVLLGTSRFILSKPFPSLYMFMFESEESYLKNQAMKYFAFQLFYSWRGFLGILSFNSV